jgi:hypothetical protein
MRKRPEAVSATALISIAAALLSISVVAVMMLAAGLSPGWGSQPAEAAPNAIDLAALDMDTTGNTVAQVPSGNVEETALGTIEECIEVTHPETFDIDFVVQGYPPSAHSLVGYDVSVTFPAGLTLNNTFTGEVAPSILGRTLISGDPQSGPFTSFVDTPNINDTTARVGPDTHSASVLDFADADSNEDIDGEENSDGFLIRYTFETTGTATGLLDDLTLSSLSSLVIDDVGEVPITAIQDGRVAVDDPGACALATPTAVDDNDTVDEDSGANAIDVLTNDSDGGAPPLTITVVTQGSNGTVVITGGGSGLTYAPDADFFGADSFTYTIQNDDGVAAVATVDMTVNSVNDPPVASDVDMGEVLEDSDANAWLPNVSDVDTGDTLTCSIATQPTHGTVFVPANCSNGGYTPDTGFLGTDSFTYRVTDSSEESADATVTVEVVLVLSTPTPTPIPTAAAATATPTPTPTPAALPGTGDGIRLDGGGSSGLTFLAIGLVLLVVAPGAVAVGVILRRKARLGR